jgi:hypothetical protein
VKVLEVAPLAAAIDERATRLGGVQIVIQDIVRGLLARSHEITLAAGPGSYLLGVRIAELDVDLGGTQRADLQATDQARADDDAQRRCRHERARGRHAPRSTWFAVALPRLTNSSASSTRSLEASRYHLARLGMSSFLVRGDGPRSYSGSRRFSRSRFLFAGAHDPSRRSAQGATARDRSRTAAAVG